MDEAEKRELIERLLPMLMEQAAKEPPLPPLREPAPIHYSDLPTDPDPNWTAYLREVRRLLAEGNEGRWVLIHNGEVVDVFDTEPEASRAARKLGRVLVRPIRTWEPAIRTPTFMYRCRISNTQLRPTG